MTDETVVDVLRDVCPEEPLCEVAAGTWPGKPVGSLEREDWVRPLKLTGGRVCLKWYDRAVERHGVVLWTPAGLQYSLRDEIHFEGPAAVDALKYDINAESVVLEPALREQTPFAEGKTDER